MLAAQRALIAARLIPARREVTATASHGSRDSLRAFPAAHFHSLSSPFARREIAIHGAYDIAHTMTTAPSHSHMNAIMSSCRNARKVRAKLKAKPLHAPRPRTRSNVHDAARKGHSIDDVRANCRFLRVIAPFNQTRTRRD